jgi:hypothetical protein
MKLPIRTLCHPCWQYLQQPVFNSEAQSIWNINRFWYLYKIELLKKCWNKECNAQTKHY